MYALINSIPHKTPDNMFNDQQPQTLCMTVLIYTLSQTSSVLSHQQHQILQAQLSSLIKHIENNPLLFTHHCILCTTTTITPVRHYVSITYSVTTRQCSMYIFQQLKPEAYQLHTKLLLAPHQSPHTTSTLQQWCLQTHTLQHIYSTTSYTQVCISRYNHSGCTPGTPLVPGLPAQGNHSNGNSPY